MGFLLRFSPMMHYLPLIARLNQFNSKSANMEKDCAMPKSSKLSIAQLRDFYRDSYVNRYHQYDTGRLRNIMMNIDLSNSDTVADFACGNGLLLEELKPFPRVYRGVDFSEEFIREAEVRYAQWPGDINFVCTDIVIFCRQHPAQFDWAFALDFSEHIYDDQFIDIFSAIASALRPTGKLVLHTPNAEFFVERLKARNFVLRQFPEHVAVRNAAEYHNLLGHAGFRDIEVKHLPHYHPILRVVSPLQNWWFLRRFLRARLLIVARPNQTGIRV